MLLLALYAVVCPPQTQYAAITWCGSFMTEADLKLTLFDPL
jgi:hypothetical protein